MHRSKFLPEVQSAFLDDFKSSDKFIFNTILLQWALVSTFAIFFYDAYFLGLLTGGVLVGISYLGYKYFRGEASLRVLNALVIMCFSIILIQESSGRIEMHFHIFIMLSFLLAYKDVKPMFAASFFIILHHLLFTYLQLNQATLFDTQIIVFNYGCGYDIAFLHAFFVLFEMGVLLRLTLINRDKLFKEIEQKESIVLLNKNLLKSENVVKEINRDLEQKIAEAVEKNSEQDRLRIEESAIAQKKLNQSIKLFGKHVISSSTDTRGVITSATESFSNLSGYSKEELIGSPHNIVRHPEVPKSIYKEMWETIKSGKEWRGELRNLTKSGETYWVDISVTPVFDDDGEIIFYNSVRHDITSRKIKEEFMANMSHELRTPLNSIIGFSSILSKKNSNQEDAKLLKQIKTSANSLLSLINDILDLSKIQASQFGIAPFTSNAYTEMTDFSYQFEGLTAKKTLKFHSHVDESLKGSFHADWTRINQIILNIISNSVKFTPVNGEISFSTEYVDGDLIVSISDNGIGMNKDTQDKVFKPFVQADGTTTRKYGGTGLGLSIVQGLVEIMRGRIEIVSAEAVGTTIKVVLPIKKVQEKHELEEKPLEPIEHLPLNTHVLVVEDNKTNQMLVEMFLEEFNVTCEIANDGLEAIEMYNPELHSLVLMDENMPNMNGLEAMKILQEKYKEKCTPIIALTANAMKGDREKFLDLGMAGYVSKPIDEDKLYRTLSELLKI